MKKKERGVNWITKALAVGPSRGGGGPSLTGLKKAGFHHVLDLNADPEEARIAKRVGVVHHSFRTTDQSSKRVWVTNMRKAVDVIQRAEKSQERVYLHCTKGLGRSPTFAMAYLISRGNSVAEAIDSVKRTNPMIWCEGNPTEKYGEILKAFAKMA